MSQAALQQRARAPARHPLTRDELFRPFVEAFKPAGAWRVGVEAERFGVSATSGAPLAYDGPGGILEVFGELASRFGWTPEAELPGGPVIALSRGSAHVSLEPGGQLELSGSALEDLHAVRDEVLAFHAELEAVTRPLGLTWIASGFHPLARQEDLGWVPKARYGIMRVYLASRGTRALDMMRRTATVQANLDYCDERDAMHKLRVALRLSPVVAAMLANAPFVEGRPFGGRSARIGVWLDVDPDRQGLVPRLWREDASLRDYVEWALDVPMFLVLRGDRILRNTGQTFRSFMADGIEGQRATPEDWTTHLNTLFPEVRLKRTLELRGADSLPLDLVSALPAIWTGLLYDERALEQADRLSAAWTFEQMEALRGETAMQGLAASFQGKTVAHAAETLIDIARDGLARRARISGGRDETVHLDVVSALVQQGLTPADRALAIHERTTGEAADRVLACVGP
jgi:glutamate--cysteine ligase